MFVYCIIMFIGILYFSSRITLTAQCAMDLSLFPLDTQNCDLIIESCKYMVYSLGGAITVRN